MATLVWADPPGTPPPPSLDPPDLMLVNDLDLRITNGPATFFPWVLDPANPAAAASTGDNFRDNVEKVEVSGASPGTYTIEVRHKGSLLGGANQDYALIIGLKPAPPMGAGLAIDEDFSGGLPAGWSVETISGVPWTIRTPVPGGSKYDNLTGGSGNFAMVDNNYRNNTHSSLRTPVLDLSANDAAVLSFRSHFYFDLLEAIYVDVSTNSGANWTNVWQWQGFNPLPTNYVFDLTSHIAGQSGVMIRFRYNSHGNSQGNYWQVDDVELEVFGGGGGDPPAGDPPGPAFGPDPVDGALDVAIDAGLSWAPGPDATSHDVFFGTSSSLGGGDFQGNQAAASFDPGALNPTTTYYWRIDEVNDEGLTVGDTWSFTTGAAPPALPGPASGPSPADGATNVALEPQLTWTAGSDTDSHDVYFGTSNPLSGADFQGNQLTASFSPGSLTEGSTFYWRIDEVNAEGTTEGTTWSFETTTPLGSIHLSGISGAALPPESGRWTAEASFLVENQDGIAEQGVTVNGSWSNGANGAGSCITDAAGACTVSKSNLKMRTTSVDFTVSSLDRAGMNYVPADNSVATSITVNQNDVDLTPSASNDSYQVEVDTLLSGNVMDNDSQGDGPASIENQTSTASGDLNLSSDGSFTYLPDPGFEGEDSFTYSIIDQDGDISNTATVTINVSSAPPPSGNPTVTTRAYKVKGIQHVEISWQDFNSATVDIRRDTVMIPDMPTANDGIHDDNIGIKGGSVTYIYEVCETGTSVCASASASF